MNERKIYGFSISGNPNLLKESEEPTLQQHQFDVYWSNSVLINISESKFDSENIVPKRKFDSKQIHNTTYKWEWKLKIEKRTETLNQI